MLFLIASLSSASKIQFYLYPSVVPLQPRVRKDNVKECTVQMLSPEREVLRKLDTFLCV